MNSDCCKCHNHDNWLKLSDFCNDWPKQLLYLPIAKTILDRHMHYFASDLAKCFCHNSIQQSLEFAKIIYKLHGNISKFSKSHPFDEYLMNESFRPLLTDDVSDRLKVRKLEEESQTSSTLDSVSISILGVSFRLICLSNGLI